MKKIRIGQIGAMHDHSADIITTLKKMSDVYDIVGFAVPEEEEFLWPEKYEGIPRMTVEELLKCGELDAVTIETSELNLSRYALMALEKGLPIHMDKPGGILCGDFEKLIDLVKEKKLLFHLGYMYRYNPAVQKLKADVEAGKLGHIYSVEAHMDCEHTAKKRQWLEQFPGGMMFFLGCHLIDMICYMQGFPKEVVPFNTATGLNGVTAQDCGFAVLKYDGGVSFAKTCAKERGGFMRRQLVVCGEKGTVELRPFEAPNNPANRTGLFTGVRECFDENGGWFYQGDCFTSETYDRYVPMMAAFASYVRGEKANPFTPDYELQVYKTVLAACGAAAD